MKRYYKVFDLIFIFLIVTLFKLPQFLVDQFGKMNFERIAFVVLGNNEGANFEIVGVYLKTLPMNLFISLLLFLGLLLVYYLFSKYDLVLSLKLISKKINLVLNLKVIKKIVKITYAMLFIFVFLQYNNEFMISAYIKNQIVSGKIYDDYYLNPNDVDISFPSEKKNLIYIIAESMTTNFDDMIIDNDNVNLIPNLKKISENNVSFSDSNEFGGLITPDGVTWTMGSLVGQTSGIPLTGPLGGNKYGKNGVFLPGAISIGQVLEEQDYENYFAIGSDAAYAGRDVYFKTHGDYEIYDLKTWKNEGKIPEDYHVFWGMEDSKLFEYSKEKLLEISSSGSPFNYTMLTVDSHFIDGYTDPSCNANYDIEYANAIECSDTLISDFIGWISEQDFYEDTVIVIVGDHPTMNIEFLELSSRDNITVYNAFLNTNKDQSQLNTNNRIFSVMDMFPSTLGALGANIEGDRLGLGTNLFSNSETLIEELGLDSFLYELSLNSKFYNRKFHSNK